MKKQYYSIVVLLLLLLNITNVAAQQKFKTNSKGQYINTVCVKFKPDQTYRLDKAMMASKNQSKKVKSKGDSYAKLGITGVDRIGEQLKVNSYRRVFRPAGKHEAKHRAHGLHLWYQITYDASVTTQDAIRQFKNSNTVEVAHELYEISPIEESAVITSTTATVQKSSVTNFITTANDPMYTDQWHYNNTGQKNGTVGKDIHLEEAWEIEKGDNRVIVAIQDSGIDINHPDLKGNLWVNEGEIPGNGVDDDNNGFVDDIHGYSFLNNGSGTIPAGDHGTHVAGTVAASTNNGIGVAGVAGGSGNNDGAKLMACAVIGIGTNGGAESFVYAADNGAVISQNSYSFRGFTDEAINVHKAAVDYFIANAGGAGKPMHGGIVFFSAANDNINLVTYPNTHEGVVMVSALNNKDQKASYSNYGTWVDIAAPGGGGQGGVLSTVPGESYGYKQGTSMACPHVSGVAALVVSNNYGNITANQLRRILEETSDPINHLNPGFENQLGKGRVNAYKALQVGNGEGVPLGLKVSNITQNSASLSWNAIAGTQQYTIRYKEVSNTNWTTVSSTSTTISLNNLEEGKHYEIQVKTATSPYSYVLQFTTAIGSLSAPSGISFAEITETNVTINWSATSGASGYILEYQEEGATDWNSLLVDQGTQVRLYDFVQKTTYNVRVKATNASIESQFSTIASFTTKASICGDIAPWKPSQYRTKGTQVAYQDVIYENQWWAEANHIPGVHEVWRKVRDCGDPNENQAPTVNITAPNNNAIIGQLILSSITLSANANDVDGTIVSIRFEVNNVALPSGNNVNWTPEAFGTYTVKVTATDDKGATATDQISITVFQEDQTPTTPTVNITNPTNGQVIEQESLTAIVLTAVASDPDGTIDKIQFSVNDVLLPEGNDVSWLPSNYGNHVIKVTVTDNSGATATDQITITIKQLITGGDCNGVTAWNPATIYPSTGGVKVSHNGNIYQNKWWTQNNEPGTGGSWGPWELIGPCSLTASKAYNDLLNDKNDSFLIAVKNTQMQILLHQKEIGGFAFSLYDLQGRYVQKLKEGFLSKGLHSLDIDISGINTGIYLVKFESKGTYRTTKKVIITE
ncbi:S8 family serine peptidase [Aquimarina sp. 2201CG1-2-11]|uniref:S8 family serine peptidase n=1 Tax=Aquimarina discodermiae TaxID=3231043 RepID=UPI003461D19E